MAVEINFEQKDIANKNLYGKFYSSNSKIRFFSILINKFLEIKLWIKVFSINIVRKFKRKIYSNVIPYESNTIIRTSLSNNYKKIKDDIENKGYIFLKNFINENYYFNLKKSFPKTYELNKSKNSHKNYDIGYIYLKDRFNPIFQRKNYFSNFYDFIKSEEFEKEVSKIFNYKNNFFCQNFVTSFATKNSFLIPHKDSLSEERKDLNLNFIYFIDGNDENIEFSGGTCIFNDNNGKEILLCPSTLKNSVLIYDNTRNFFHGFKILKKNCFRKAVTFQFRQIYKNN